MTEMERYRLGRVLSLERQVREWESDSKLALEELRVAEECLPSVEGVQEAVKSDEGLIELTEVLNEVREALEAAQKALRGV